MNLIMQVWTVWICISGQDWFYIVEFGVPLYVLRGYICANFHVLNSMLVYAKWVSVAQQLVHNLDESACRMCIVFHLSFEAQIYEQCMVHI